MVIRLGNVLGSFEEADCDVMRLISVGDPACGSELLLILENL